MKTSIYIAMLAMAVAPDASAIQVVGEQGNAVAYSSQAVPAEREGTIEKIDPGNKIMVVDGTNYFLYPDATLVHGSRLLALRKHDRIRYKALNESGKGRIVEIWLISPAQR